MKYEEALRILDPNTSAEALNEIEYYAGFKAVDAINEAMNEACIVACEALNKQIPNGKWISLEPEIGLYECSECGHKILRAKCNYCPNCGQRLE